MEAKYGEAVKVGAIGGVLCAILFVAVIVIGLVVTNVTWFTLGELLVWVLLAAVMLFTGVFAVASAGKKIVNVDEAAMAASIAGGIAGFIGGLVFAVAIAVLTVLPPVQFPGGPGTLRGPRHPEHAVPDLRGHILLPVAFHHGGGGRPRGPRRLDLLAGKRK